MKKANILVIDDEKNIRRSMEMILTGEGYSVSSAENLKTGWELIQKKIPNLIFLDVMLPDGDGLSLLNKIKENYKEIEVIIISGHATINMAVEATRSGAYDFLEKPLQKEKILLIIKHLHEKLSLQEKFERLKNEKFSGYKIIGKSAAINKVKEQIKLAAPTNSKIIISGESGTGKELIAYEIHHKSNRNEKSFVKMNCAAIPENLIESELFGYEKGAFTGAVKKHDGKFLQADGGTLFLDEIADMSLNTQTKVLRILQDGKFERVGGNETISVNVRVVAATNKNLESMVKNGQFREDLFYRLNVFPIKNPPLRERIDDIPLLLEHIITAYCAENNRRPVKAEKDVLRILKNYSWPGNIRELKNIVERMLIMTPGNTIKKETAPSHLLESEKTVLTKIEAPGDLTLKKFREKSEKIFIEQCLEKCGGNISRAANLLGIERTNLHKKMKFLGIKK